MIQYIETVTIGTERFEYRFLKKETAVRDARKAWRIPGTTVTLERDNGKTRQPVAF